MNAKTYAQAIHELSLSHKESVASRVIAFLKAKGHTHLLPRIVVELEAIQAKDARMKRADVHYALHADRAHAEKEAHKLITERGGDPMTWELVFHEDPSLIGGYTIRLRDAERDGSYRTALHHLYLRLKNA